MKKKLSLWLVGAILVFNSTTVFAIDRDGGAVNPAVQAAIEGNKGTDRTGKLYNEDELKKDTTGSVTVKRSTTIATAPAPKIDRNKLIARINANLGGNISPLQIAAETKRVDTRMESKGRVVGNGDTGWGTSAMAEKYEDITITPAINAYFTLKSTRKDIEIEPREWLYNVWRSTGPASVIPVGKSATTQWNGSKNESVSFTKEGDYVITSTEYKKWKLYTEYTYEIVVKQEQTGQVYYRETVALNKYQETKEGEDITTKKTYRIRITPQDIGKIIPVKSTDTTKQYDADVILIQ